MTYDLKNCGYVCKYMLLYLVHLENIQKIKDTLWRYFSHCFFPIWNLEQ